MNKKIIRFAQTRQGLALYNGQPPSKKKKVSTSVRRLWLSNRVCKELQLSKLSGSWSRRLEFAANVFRRHRHENLYIYICIYIYIYVYVCACVCEYVNVQICIIPI
jgi:hypothetical protein